MRKKTIRTGARLLVFSALVCTFADAVFHEYDDSGDGAAVTSHMPSVPSSLEQREREVHLFPVFERISVSNHYKRKFTVSSISTELIKYVPKQQAWRREVKYRI